MDDGIINCPECGKKFNIHYGKLKCGYYGKWLMIECIECKNILKYNYQEIKG